MELFLSRCRTLHFPLLNFMKFPLAHFSLKGLQPKEELCQSRGTSEDLQPVEDPHWSRYTPERTAVRVS